MAPIKSNVPPRPVWRCWLASALWCRTDSCTCLLSAHGESAAASALKDSSTCAPYCSAACGHAASPWLLGPRRMAPTK
jgi:hypothetical protein